MMSLEAFPFSQDCITRIQDSVVNYWKMARIDVTATSGHNSQGEPTIDVTVHQKELVNERILTSGELIKRAQDIFDGCVPEGYSVRYNPKTYKQ
jgi:hypothetical protein